MTAQTRSALRVVVLPAADWNIGDSPTRRLLENLGHDVSRARTPQDAVQQVSDERTDLVIVDITNSQDNRQALTTLLDLPLHQVPGQIVVYADALDGELRAMQRRSAPPHVHVFLKPLHVHGLLNMLRQLEREQETMEPAV